MILLISGSTRGGSTNTAALRTAHAFEDIETVLYEGLTGLPHFNPDDDYDPLPPPVIELRAQIAAADGVLFCTPEYAGALPGSFKNLLDWTVGGGEMDGRPATWINVAGPGRGEKAHESLRIVLGYVGAQIAEPARVIVPHGAVGPDGLIAPPEVRAAIEDALRGFADHLAASP